MFVNKRGTITFYSIKPQRLQHFVEFLVEKKSLTKDFIFDDNHNCTFDDLYVYVYYFC